jgi:hypothetical protein
MDTYGHLFQDADDLGIRAVDEALASEHWRCSGGTEPSGRSPVSENTMVRGAGGGRAGL